MAVVIKCLLNLDHSLLTYGGPLLLEVAGSIPDCVIPRICNALYLPYNKRAALAFSPVFLLLRVADGMRGWELGI